MICCGKNLKIQIFDKVYACIEEKDELFYIRRITGKIPTGRFFFKWKHFEIETFTNGLYKVDTRLTPDEYASLTNISFDSLLVALDHSKILTLSMTPELIEKSFNDTNLDLLSSYMAHKKDKKSIYLNYPDKIEKNFNTSHVIINI